MYEEEKKWEKKKKVLKTKKKKILPFTYLLFFNFVLIHVIDACR